MFCVEMLRIFMKIINLIQDYLCYVLEQIKFNIVYYVSKLKEEDIVCVM